MSVRLTKAQQNLLSEIRDVRQPISEVYAPANKLVFLGLAEWERGRFADFLKITPAGRAALDQGVGE